MAAGILRGQSDDYQSMEAFTMNRKQDDEVREKQIKKLIKASSPEKQRRIRHRDDQGLNWRAELQELERGAGL